MIKNVDFVSIPVADQKRALAFYTETRKGTSSCSGRSS